ncbi:hypothetical protein [Sphingobium sp. SYK-6]|uniref:hypothetical protein n=1 Tax=Sphingobium sp. (strain NBRC 103272 / SYK-6) TaxID=627192 RepID=UPI0006887F40|nr:hypothetical protein [Sphingobium sp. SYK-6]
MAHALRPFPALLLLASCAGQPALDSPDGRHGVALPHAAVPGPAPTAPSVSDRTFIADREALERLLGNSGITLQWIGWGRRGDLAADYATDLLHLRGGQSASDGPGKLVLDGVVTRIDRDSFTFEGRIDIIDTPDIGRVCRREGQMSFRVTQNRRYWRLQEMEACDGLTDYVDIYF